VGAVMAMRPDLVHGARGVVTPPTEPVVVAQAAR
jgi:hypothetical protein